MPSGGGWSTQRRSTFASRWDKSTSKAILQGILDAVTLPGDVYRGEVDPRSDEAIGRAFDLAGTLTLGAGAIPAGANDLRMGIKAYHASPHDFDKFDMSKVGTGQGAQSYGHGLYVAENPAVSGRGGQYDMEFRAKKNVQDTAPDAQAIADHADEWQALVEQRRIAQGPDGRGDTSAIDVQMDAVHAKSVEETLERNPGTHIYEVDIAANPEDFLDWDKPLSEQARVAAVPEILEAARKEAQSRALAATRQDRADQLWEMVKDPMKAPGEFAVEALAPRQRGGGRAAELSEKLRQAGVPGVRYRDAGSRGADEGTSNYVVFDDSLISILKKYGVVGPVLAALGLSQAMPDRAEASEQQGGGW